MSEKEQSARPGKGSERAAREKRLAEALRTNLRKRKEAAKGAAALPPSKAPQNAPKVP